MNANKKVPEKELLKFLWKTYEKYFIFSLVGGEIGYAYYDIETNMETDQWVKWHPLWCQIEEYKTELLNPHHVHGPLPLPPTPVIKKIRKMEQRFNSYQGKL